MSTVKMVINKCYGGYSLSDKALIWLAENGSEDAKKDLEAYDNNPSSWYKDVHHLYDEDRNNPLLVACVEALGDKASGQCAKLVVVEIEVNHLIDTHDGLETLGRL